MLERTLNITVRKTDIERVARGVTNFFLPEGQMLFVAGRRVEGQRLPNEILGFSSYNPDYSIVSEDPNRAGDLNPDFKVICETKPSDTYHVALDPERLDPRFQIYLTEEGLREMCTPLRIRLWRVIFSSFKSKAAHTA